MIERGRVVVEHQLVLCGAERIVCSHTLIERRSLASHLLEEFDSHIVHTILVERLQLHGSRLVCLISSHVGSRHAVVDISVPESLILAILELAHQRERVLATCAELLKLNEPRAQFLHEQRILAVALHDGRHLFYTVELSIQIVVILLVIVSKTESLGLPRLYAAIACLGIARVYGECAVSIVRFGSNVNKRALPVVDGIVCRNIPVIVGDTVESELRSLAVLHRIAQHTACLFGSKVGFESVHRTLHDDMTGIVGNGEVPPIVSRALDARVYEVKCLLCEVRANNGTCPEHVDRRIETLAIDGELSVLLGACPQL